MQTTEGLKEMFARRQNKYNTHKSKMVTLFVVKSDVSVCRLNHDVISVTSSWYVCEVRNKNRGGYRHLLESLDFMEV